MNANDIMLSIIIIMVFIGTIYIFSFVFMGIVKQKYFNKNYISWEDFNILKENKNV